MYKVLCLLGTALAGPSNITSKTWTPDKNVPQRFVKMDYYTHMDKDGQIFATFSMVLTNQNKGGEF